MTKMTVHDIPSTYPVASSSSYPVGPSGLSRVASYKLSVGGGFDLNGILINKIDIQNRSRRNVNLLVGSQFPFSHLSATGNFINNRETEKI